MMILEWQVIKITLLVIILNCHLLMSAQNHHHSTPSSDHSQQYPPTHPHQHHTKDNPLIAEAEFEKNYPKNIFIPIIEYLTELGYKQAYQKCVGCKSEFQGKNVVSLSSIYTLITQDWFRRNINNENLLAHISNKILLNSKIKKKLFHLLIAQTILMHTYFDPKDFKRRVSKEANIIARKPAPTDQLFDYPNAIIYLLHLFLKILLFHANKKTYNKLEDEISKLHLQQESGADPKGKSIGSKQEYKSYVKDIVHVFSGKGLSTHNLADILQQAKQNILQKDRQIRQKYQLIEGIPKWTLFIKLVIMRCFQYKRKDMKITNFLFNEWINQFKNKILSVFDNSETVPSKSTVTQNEWQKIGIKDIEAMTNNLSFGTENWNPSNMSIGTLPNEKQSKKQQTIQSKQASMPSIKQFSPIILLTCAKE